MWAKVKVAYARWSGAATSRFEAALTDFKIVRDGVIYVVAESNVVCEATLVRTFSRASIYVEPSPDPIRQARVYETPDGHYFALTYVGRDAGSLVFVPLPTRNHFAKWGEANLTPDTYIRIFRQKRLPAPDTFS